MEYSRKRLVKIPMERNSQRTIENRQLYARGIEYLSDSCLIYLDETGVNQHQTRNYGYSPINSKSYKLVKANRGTNISCMVAIKVTGVICFELKDGAFNGDDFIIFIKTHSLPHFQRNPTDVLIMDNCRFHHRRDVTMLLEEKRIPFMFLPPYSPQLNPIEEYFSSFKSQISAFVTINISRLELKERIIEILNNPIVDFNGWFRNMRRWF